MNPGSNTLPKFLAAPCSSMEDKTLFYYLKWVFTFPLNCTGLLSFNEMRVLFGGCYKMASSETILKYRVWCKNLSGRPDRTRRL